ncbi:MAG: DUF4270 domain-containing protein, partial [Bacteroidota bacterium]|nr:DUF4270 domain-containing protein [Bacteroidota bacterium]
MRKLFSIAIAIFFFISACTKIESTTIGSGLIPPIDGVTTLDTTLDVSTNNYIDPLGDSAKVYKTDDHVIGVINDDMLFGKTRATTYFELKPTSYPLSFPTSEALVVDSAVLIMSYKGVFGDTTKNQNWEVREVTEPIRGDTVFNVSKSFSTGDVLGTKNIDIQRLKDSVNYGFETAAKQVRIKLSMAFATRLITTFDSSKNGAAYSSDSLFRVNFKGFAVAPATGSPGNALIRINLSDTNTKLALFYNYHVKDSAATKRDTTVTYFRFNTTSSATVSGNGNYIKRDRSGAQVQSFINTKNNDSLVFMQTTPGTFATVKILGLRLLPNMLIHRAELLAFQAPEMTNQSFVLSPPRYLLLSSYDSSKNVQINLPNDFTVSSGTPNIASFGGFVMEQAVPGYGIVKAYNFDVSRYVQGIVTRKDSSLTLRLSAPSNDSLHYTPPYPQPNAVSTFFITPSVANNIADGRVRLGGGGMTRQNQLRMRLR